MLGCPIALVNPLKIFFVGCVFLAHSSFRLVRNVVRFFNIFSQCLEFFPIPLNLPISSCFLLAIAFSSWFCHAPEGQLSLSF